MEYNTNYHSLDKNNNKLKYFNEEITFKILCSIHHTRSIILKHSNIV